MSDSLWPHGLQHTWLLCLSLSPGVCSNSQPSSWWCYPTISSSASPSSFCCLSFPASGSFLMSRFFPSYGQSIRASVSVLLMNIQGWFPFKLTGLISLKSKGLSRVLQRLSNVTQLWSSRGGIWTQTPPGSPAKLSVTVQSINSLALSLLYDPTLTSVCDHWKNL